ncbi:MAG: FAD-dependent oxidoreductase [Chthoniobacterales bacterium]
MDYDFAIIGGGSAGYAAARTATSEGLRTVVIEGGEEVAGLCILRGCMPSKTLLESANRATAARESDEFGIEISSVRVDTPKIIERKRRIIADFASYRREQLENGEFELVRGHAAFVDAHTVTVKKLDGSTATLTARSFLISTGSQINVPPIPGLADCGALTSDDILDLTDLPKSVIVLGGGPVALELAHYLNASGVETTVLQRSDHLLSWFDPELADVVADQYRDQNMTVHTGTNVTGIECDGARKRVIYNHGDQECSVEADAIFNGLGRRPNTGSLELISAKVATSDDGKLDVRKTMQTSADHIFAAGDVCGPFEIVHLAITQGEVAARNAARLLGETSTGDLEKVDYRLALFGVFTDPEVAAVGLSESTAAEKGVAVIAASYPFDDHGKSIVMGAMRGSVKLIADPATGEILGGACVGPHATDLIHEIVVAMAFHSTAAQLAAIPHYHPTLSEIWTYPAEELADKVSASK